MSISRRRFCLGVASASLSAPLVGASRFASTGEDRPGDAEYNPFRHGVASGDPLADGVILWTRVTGADGRDRVEVDWKVATDPDMRDVVDRGTMTTRAGRDFTVKVEPVGLSPGMTYYYQFGALGHDSVIGRTKTLPVGGVDRLRLGVASCSNYPFGFFNAYALIAQRADLDAVLHLGDYLYEYANGEYGDGAPIGRVPDPNREMVSLSDYRRRHAQYKTDPDLQEAHRQHPFITVWDDHESTNNAWKNGAENHDPQEGEGDWQLRKQRSIQTYHEWMPIREVSQARQQVTYRSFQFGDLVDIIMLDTRLIARDEQAPEPDDLAIINDPSRTLLGKTQENWLFEELAHSKTLGTRWRLLGQQVMFGQLTPSDSPNPQESGPGPIINTDQWDGYASARERVFDHLREHQIDNVVVLTGDIHSSWALDLTPKPFDAEEYNPETGQGSHAVEFITPAITSPGADSAEAAAREAAAITSGSPHIKYVDRFRRGYLLLDIDRERTQAEWYHLETVGEPSHTVFRQSVQDRQRRKSCSGSEIVQQRPRERSRTGPGEREIQPPGNRGINVRGLASARALATIMKNFSVRNRAIRVC